MKEGLRQEAFSGRFWSRKDRDSVLSLNETKGRANKIRKARKIGIKRNRNHLLWRSRSYGSKGRKVKDQGWNGHLLV